MESYPPRTCRWKSSTLMTASPQNFPVVAPFLADIDTSGGRGQIYFRVTETPSVLNKSGPGLSTHSKERITSESVPVQCLTPDLDSSFLSVLHPLFTPCFLLSFLLPSLHRSFIHSFIHLLTQEVHRGFPDAKFTPTHAVVATWENVAPYEEQTRTNGPSNKVETVEGWGLLVFMCFHSPTELTPTPPDILLTCCLVKHAAPNSWRLCITCNQPWVWGLFVIPLPLQICLLTF